MFAKTLKTLNNAEAIGHGNANTGGFVRNMFYKVFTKSVEEASEEYEED
jgi:hypothetical protein